MPLRVQAKPALACIRATSALGIVPFQTGTPPPATLAYPHPRGPRTSRFARPPSQVSTAAPVGDECCAQQAPGGFTVEALP